MLAVAAVAGVRSRDARPPQRTAARCPAGYVAADAAAAPERRAEVAGLRSGAYAAAVRDHARLAAAPSTLPSAAASGSRWARPR